MANDDAHLVVLILHIVSKRGQRCVSVDIILFFQRAHWQGAVPGACGVFGRAPASVCVARTPGPGGLAGPAAAQQGL